MSILFNLKIIASLITCVRYMTLQEWNVMGKELLVQDELNIQV